jgi:pimeloyl-ACP methyl ester carboxylesterase
MSNMTAASNINAPTQFLQVKNDVYAYRRFGGGPGRPLLCLQHFMGTLDNWDPAVTDPLAAGREVILFPHRSHPTESPRGNRERIEVDYTHRTAALQQVADRIAANSLNGRASGHCFAHSSRHIAGL